MTPTTTIALASVCHIRALGLPRIGLLLAALFGLHSPQALSSAGLLPRPIYCLLWANAFAAPRRLVGLESVRWISVLA
ncbi:hypothetical protein FB45DRAFT_943135, partial [Roridomyces roridus]